VTTRLLGPLADARATARFVAKRGSSWPACRSRSSCFRELDPRACFESVDAEGDWTAPERTFATVRATGRAVLGGERVALNFLQRLSERRP